MSATEPSDVFFGGSVDDDAVFPPHRLAGAPAPSSALEALGARVASAAEASFSSGGATGGASATLACLPASAIAAAKASGVAPPRVVVLASDGRRYLGSLLGVEDGGMSLELGDAVQLTRRAPGFRHLAAAPLFLPGERIIAVYPVDAEDARLTAGGGALPAAARASWSGALVGTAQRMAGIISWKTGLRRAGHGGAASERV